MMPKPETGARTVALTPQAHGGALRIGTPGFHGIPKGPWRSMKRDAVALLREATPEAVQTLIEKMRSTDERVSTVAAEQILNRSLGRPGEMPQGDEDTGGMPDMAHLTAGERLELANALDVVMRLTGRGPA